MEGGSGPRECRGYVRSLHEEHEGAMAIQSQVRRQQAGAQVQRRRDRRLLEGMSAEASRTVLGGLFDALQDLRTELSVHSVAIVEAREGETWESTWQRAHTHCAKRYDDGPGLHVTVSGLVRERAETL